MDQDTFSFVQAQFVKVLEVDAATITRDTRFADDLETDSIDLIEVVNAVERDLGLTIEEQELYDLETVGELVDLIDRHRAGR